MNTMKTYKIYAIRLAWKGRYFLGNSTVILNNLLSLVGLVLKMLHLSIRAAKFAVTFL